MAIRSLAHAAEVLTDRKEQDEVLSIFDKINKETGWRIGFVYKELKEKWGWNEQPSPQEFSQTHTAARQAKEAQEAQQRQIQEQAHRASLQFEFNQQQSMVAAMSQSPMQPTPPPPPKKPPAGIPNPMYAKADFNLPQHPYQNFYVAPNTMGGQVGNWGLAPGAMGYYNS